MVVSATMIKLKNVLRFYRYVKTADLAVKNTRRSSGNIFADNTSTGFLVHFTKTAWRSEEDFERYRSSQEFKDYMAQFRNIAAEIKTSTWESDQVPTWREVFNKLD